MKRNRTIGGLLGLLVAGTAMALVPSMSYATDTNDPNHWENEPGEECVKVDDTGTDEGGYTVPSPEPEGRDYSTLIIKKGSGTSQSPNGENTVIEDPQAGQTYYFDNNPQAEGYSHVILCTVPEPEPVDVCPNIDGVQTEVPGGMVIVDGQCVEESEPNDVCPNIDGVQTEVPGGMVIVDGQCVEESEPTDVCPNLEGDQTTVPAGMELNGAGNCVTDTEVKGEEEPENNGGNNGGTDGTDTEVLGAQASAPVPTVINAGVSGSAEPTRSLWASPAMLTLLAALLGLLALGARAAGATVGRHKV